MQKQSTNPTCTKSRSENDYAHLVLSNKSNFQWHPLSRKPWIRFSLQSGPQKSFLLFCCETEQYMSICKQVHAERMKCERTSRWASQISEESVVVRCVFLSNFFCCARSENKFVWAKSSDGEIFFSSELRLFTFVMLTTSVSGITMFICAWVNVLCRSKHRKLKRKTLIKHKARQGWFSAKAGRPYVT